MKWVAAFIAWLLASIVGLALKLLFWGGLVLVVLFLLKQFGVI